MDYKIIIPARYASQRLPGKPLLDICGKPMIQRVYERATQTRAQRVVVATDDHRIAKACRAFDAEVCMTSSEHPSGTDRLHEVAKALSFDANDIVVNLQGDEPLMPISVIDQVADNLSLNPNMSIASLCEPIDDERQMNDSNIVKTVFSASGRALYFSRAAIPFVRDTKDSKVLRAYRHLGIYAYRVSFLHDYVSWPQADIEEYEKLEQLRALYFDAGIHMALANGTIPPGVDTQHDLELVRSYFEQNCDESNDNCG